MGRFIKRKRGKATNPRATAQAVINALMDKAKIDGAEMVRNYQQAVNRIAMGQFKNVTPEEAIEKLADTYEGMIAEGLPEALEDIWSRIRKYKKRKARGRFLGTEVGVAVRTPA